MARPQASKFVKQVITPCDLCATTKPRLGTSMDTLASYPILEYPFSKLALDFVDLPPTKVKDQVFDYIVVNIFCSIHFFPAFLHGF